MTYQQHLRNSTMLAPDASWRSRYPPKGRILRARLSYHWIRRVSSDLSWEGRGLGFLRVLGLITEWKRILVHEDVHKVYTVGFPLQWFCWMERGQNSLFSFEMLQIYPFSKQLHVPYHPSLARAKLLIWCLLWVLLRSSAGYEIIVYCRLGICHSAPIEVHRVVSFLLLRIEFPCIFDTRLLGA